MDPLVRSAVGSACDAARGSRDAEPDAAAPAPRPTTVAAAGGATHASMTTGAPMVLAVCALPFATASCANEANALSWSVAGCGDGGAEGIVASDVASAELGAS